MQDEWQKKIQERRRKRTERKIIKITTGLTTLTLTCCLIMNHCSSKKVNKFHFYQDYKGNIVVSKNDYIGYEYIEDYYVLELYHKGLDRNILNIAYRFKYTSGNSKYINIFNNYFIAYDNNTKDNYEFINVIPLTEFLERYNLIKEGYSYEDMEEIYDIIRKNYIFEYDMCYNQKNSPVKKKTLI